jgi:hypothetical protein
MLSAKLSIFRRGRILDYTAALKVSGEWILKRHTNVYPSIKSNKSKSPQFHRCGIYCNHWKFTFAPTVYSYNDKSGKR